MNLIILKVLLFQMRVVTCYYKNYCRNIEKRFRRVASHWRSSSASKFAIVNSELRVYLSRLVVSSNSRVAIPMKTVGSGAFYENAIPILRIGRTSVYREGGRGGGREWSDVRVGGLHEVNRP